ncbi:hypothetical protein [Nocardiopsis lucentensis]|uniref:hypothetical protein n=1 Tax=Nocardiopsis lucentensis TaxID=53441 RepID=UPI0003487E10|nr:hypothetical protein [Nocardiopsis lucentensis]
MTTIALHYRDGAWTSGPDPVEEATEAQTVEEDWRDSVARAGFNRHPFAVYSGPYSYAYAEMFRSADGTTFFMNIAHGDCEQHLYFHSVVDALEHAARWAPAFALQHDDPDLVSPGVRSEPDLEDVDDEELAALRQAPHP